MNSSDIQIAIDVAIGNNNTSYVDTRTSQLITQHVGLDDPHSIKPYVDYKINNALSNFQADQRDLSNVDNTADAEKPVSIYQQEALDLKLDKSVFNNTIDPGISLKVVDWSTIQILLTDPNGNVKSTLVTLS